MTYYGRDQDIKEHITLKYFLSFNRGNFEIEKYFAPFKVISAFGFLLLICTIIWRNIPFKSQSVWRNIPFKIQSG